MFSAEYHHSVARYVHAVLRERPVSRVLMRIHSHPDFVCKANRITAHKIRDELSTNLAYSEYLIKLTQGILLDTEQYCTSNDCQQR